MTTQSDNDMLVCCGWRMRRIDVHPGVLVAFACDTCRTQRWFIVDDEVPEDFALDFAKRLT